MQKFNLKYFSADNVVVKKSVNDIIKVPKLNIVI
jgi:hypothetical protein